MLYIKESCFLGILAEVPFWQAITGSLTIALDQKLVRFWIDVENRGGLKGSMQHWLAVYPPEFQIPMFFVAVD